MNSAVQLQAASNPPPPPSSATAAAAAAAPVQLLLPSNNAAYDAALFSRHPRRILVLYVGGTIGMKKNLAGALEPCAGYLTEEMNKMHELKESKEIAPFDIIEYEELLDSSDMNAADYLRITADVQAHYDDYDGFLIAHGTDTMHHTASALSFLLYNLAKPVIVTGAMVPLAEPFNDARRNLIISMMIASNPKINEVCIFFNDRLFRGNRCEKMYHTFAAFDSPNYPPLGVMEAAQFVLKERYLLPQPTGAMAILSNLSGRVFVVPVPPDADEDAILAVLRANERRPPPPPSKAAGKAAEAEAMAMVEAQEQPVVDAIILILRGVGSITGSAAGIIRRIATVAQQRGIVAVATQREFRGTFSPQEVHRLRVIAPSLVYLGDMTTAAAELKLMYLFGKGLPAEQVAVDMSRNLRGEITPAVRAAKL